uniref:HicA toxin of toxin-antitoxin n=1 Tax=Candidatus Kentrum sp. LPFa TaxID=2126335 RepID=A0A450WF52_9GAMM|nr:MAG: HicA toxin of toxin-antitoxin [Candidatus Kentron sp. LPFa]
MKRTALIHHLSKHGCKLIREGKRHSIWKNKYSGEMTTVPRHNEIKEFMARKICKDVGIIEP